MNEYYATDAWLLGSREHGEAVAVADAEVSAPFGIRAAEIVKRDAAGQREADVVDLRAVEVGDDPEGAKWLGFARTILDQVDVTDYVVTTVETRGRREIRHELTRFQSEKHKSEVCSAFLDRKAFGVIANVGLKCLKDDEIVAAGYESINRLRNRARSSLKTLICLQDYAGLPDPLKIKHNAIAAILMVANRVTAPKKVVALEGVLAEKMEKLTFQQTLKFFEKK